MKGYIRSKIGITKPCYHPPVPTDHPKRPTTTNNHLLSPTNHSQRATINPEKYHNDLQRPLLLPRKTSLQPTTTYYHHQTIHNDYYQSLPPANTPWWPFATHKNLTITYTNALSPKKKSQNDSQQRITSMNNVTINYYQLKNSRTTHYHPTTSRTHYNHLLLRGNPVRATNTY